jgi:hypothetical protein
MARYCEAWQTEIQTELWQKGRRTSTQRSSFFPPVLLTRLKVSLTSMLWVNSVSQRLSSWFKRVWLSTVTLSIICFLRTESNNSLILFSDWGSFSPPREWTPVPTVKGIPPMFKKQVARIKENRAQEKADRKLKAIIHHNTYGKIRGQW